MTIAIQIELRIESSVKHFGKDRYKTIQSYIL